MKSMMTLLALAMMMLLFLSSAGAQIRLQSRKIPPPLNLGSTNLNLGTNQPQSKAGSNQPEGKLFQPLNPLPKNPFPQNPLSERRLLEIPQTNYPPARLPAGVYETKPYAGIVVVPGAQHDDCSVLGPGNMFPASRMPVIRPGIQAIPKGQSKP